MPKHLHPLPSTLLLYFFIPLSHAHRIDIIGTRSHPLYPRSRLHRRGSGDAPLNNSADISYHADILLGGQKFQVLVDTGSSDLWVVGNVTNSSDTGLEAAVNYAIGNVKGPVKTAQLQFADHVVEDQVFMEIPPSGLYPEGTGIIGLGPSSSSLIFRTLPNPLGAPVLNRIFSENLSLPNYFTILLGRSRDPTTFFTGIITISSLPSPSPSSPSEIPFDPSSILSQPKLPVTLVLSSQSSHQHHQILLDKDGIIGPDKNIVRVHTSVDDAQSSLNANRSSNIDDADGLRATAVLDCGFSLPQVPRSVSDAIYGEFPGSEFTTVSGLGGVWLLPCEQEVNVTFVFGGLQYPMHPLDMTLDPEVFGLSNATNGAGKRVCIGSFQPFSYDRGSEPTYDMVLGMAFMRNVFTLFNYGDFMLDFNLAASPSPSSLPLAEPYIQMLSITSPSEAHSDFVRVRLDGIDTTPSQWPNSGPSKSGKDGSGKMHEHQTETMIWYVVAAVGVFLILLVTGALVVWKARKKKLEKRRELDRERERRRRQQEEGTQETQESVGENK